MLRYEESNMGLTPRFGTRPFSPSGDPIPLKHTEFPLQFLGVVGTVPAAVIHRSTRLLNVLLLPASQ